ncbi:MAG: hypothetical protein CSA62_12755 [Planctomycetota bacterium]|nr:MAG: hypothetical protein CSA62_12755 [Planctomycetota bacterium]
MLVGARLGLDINGCNFPGHFLDWIYYEGQIVLVDCFRGGLLFGEDVLVRRNPVLHPLVSHFFHAFEAGRYRRNDRPWPGG